MKINETHPKEKAFVLWDHCQNILDDPRMCKIYLVPNPNDRFWLPLREHLKAGHHQPTSKTPFKWRFAGSPTMYAGYGGPLYVYFLFMFQAVDLNDYKKQIHEYVESRMTFIAPNLSIIVGASTAAKLMGKSLASYFKLDFLCFSH